MQFLNDINWFYTQFPSSLQNWLFTPPFLIGKMSKRDDHVFNPKPHGSGPITQKVLKCKKSEKIPNPQKTSAESKSWVMYPSKNVVLCLFLAPEQANAWKMGNNSVCYLSRPQHFRPHPCGGVGWQWGAGGKPLNRAKVGSRQNCGRLFADCRPHRSPSIFYLK
jgi:hypothetical protein